MYNVKEQIYDNRLNTKCLVHMKPSHLLKFKHYLQYAHNWQFVHMVLRQRALQKQMQCLSAVSAADFLFSSRRRFLVFILSLIVSVVLRSADFEYFYKVASLCSDQTHHF